MEDIEYRIESLTEADELTDTEQTLLVILVDLHEEVLRLRGMVDPAYQQEVDDYE